MAKHMMGLTVNGDTYDLVVSDNQTLLDVIRDNIGLKGTKARLQRPGPVVSAVSTMPKGRRSCRGITHALEWDGESITTIEGLESSGEPDAIQKAFIEFGAVQCGVCTPGVIMSAKAILNKYPQPTEEQMNAGLAGVLCRCTGHVKVKEAIRNDHRIRESGSDVAGD